MGISFGGMTFGLVASATVCSTSGPAEFLGHDELLRERFVSNIFQNGHRCTTRVVVSDLAD
jgi:hypothetical protein